MSADILPFRSKIKQQGESEVSPEEYELSTILCDAALNLLGTMQMDAAIIGIEDTDPKLYIVVANAATIEVLLERVNAGHLQ